MGVMKGEEKVNNDKCALIIKLKIWWYYFGIKQMKETKLLQPIAKSNWLLSLKFSPEDNQFWQIIYHFYYIHEPSQFTTN